MDLRTRLLVSSSTRLTLGVCVLAVDNVARLFILCLTLCKIGLPLRQALATAYIPKCPLEFVPRCQRFVPCCKPRLSFLSPASPASVRPTSATRLTVLPEIITSFSYIRLGHLAHERSRQRSSLETVAYIAADAGRRAGERERGTSRFF